MTTIEIALLETNPYGQHCASSWFKVRNLRPAGAAAALFMDDVRD